MRESTARNLQNYEEVQQEPIATPKISRRVAISKLEISLLVGLGVLVLSLMVTLVGINVSMTAAQNNLDEITTKVNKASTENVNLRQEISEMTSFDRLSSFAKEHNLKMSNKNVRNVSK
ncbi:cell division protein FtsL [Companilactobacillus baiquanensis]|uniref:Cell division protein FtsL n=1 Tax=Companilactobacillus baiquanensis TaxID=2486005 RepID=A0ABW1UUS5_9LACO|nr:cell division protein FtsL [Companilactobacillus baiquanensis]